MATGGAAALAAKGSRLAAGCVDACRVVDDEEYPAVEAAAVAVAEVLEEEGVGPKGLAVPPRPPPPP